MPRVLELEAYVQGFDSQALFSVVYGGGGFLRAYHKAANGDPDAQVGEWQGDARTVSFTTPVDAPAIIKRLVGKDVMRVQEAQARAALPGGAIRLTSLPVPDMPGGAKFATRAVFTFTNNAGGCRVHCEVTCSAAGPYGLTGTIEAFMADSARKSLQEFLDFIPAYIQQQQQAAAPAAAAPIAAAAPAPIAVAAGTPAWGASEPAPAWGAAEPSEQFYDAPEALPLPPFPVALAAAAGGGGGGEGLRFEDQALLYLRYQCRTGDQLVGLLQVLEQQVRSLEEKVAALQAAAEARQAARRWLPELPDTVSTRQALLGACMLASGTAAAALMYGRRFAAAAAR